MGLRKNGASPGAAATLWLGNPTLNPAVLGFIILTIGWPWALLRLLLGIALVAAAAAVTIRFTANTPPDGTNVGAETLDTTGAPVREDARPRAALPVQWLGAVLRLGLRLTPEYLIMILLLGAARAYLFPTGALTTGHNSLALLGLAVGGTLFAIPTAGEVPIIQTMLASGAGAAPAGVLLLTLAPLSLPSMLMLGRVLPGRVLAAFALLTVAAGVVAGLAAYALHL